MRILVTGATGFIGSRLAVALLAAGHQVVCMSRKPENARNLLPTQAIVVQGDVQDDASLVAAMQSCEATYYLVHSMEGDGFDFEERDRVAARTFAGAAQKAGINRIIYLGGLAEDAGRLSAHLRSRHEVGAILREGSVTVTEMRAALVVGPGGASYEMLRQLVERLPFMITPRWTATRTQPIALADVVDYLVAALGDPAGESAVYEIGGPEIMTYREMMSRFARARGLRRVMFPVPVLTPRLSSYWVDLVTDVPASIARPLIEGLTTEMIVRNDNATKAFGPPKLTFEQALAIPAASESKREPPFLWTRRVPGHLLGVARRRFAPSVLTDEQVRLSANSAADVWAQAVGLGGRKGYPILDWAWGMRGQIDRWLGGPGLNRGGPAGDEVKVGDTLDFWKVVELTPQHRLRLRALMKLPGVAELEIAVTPVPTGGCVVVQTARFRPSGIFGRLYWWSLLPMHHIIFRGMAERLAK
jgi:uncharacterized protein YbjT (DUF2867 family)